MSQPLPPEPEDTRPQGGFGYPIRKAPEAKPEWRQRKGSPGIWENEAGQVKTEIPLPKSSLDAAIEVWAKAMQADIGEDYFP